MKINKGLLLLLLAGCFSVSHPLIAQQSLKDVRKELTYSATRNASLPDWVNLMYAPDPNMNEVMQRYREYYITHPFVKNQHTRYYSRWVHENYSFLDDDGFIRKPSPAQREALTQKLQQAKQSSARFGQGSLWECIGPFDFDKDANGRSHAPGAAHVYNLERAASNPDIMVAGTATAGLWRTTNHGQSWYCISRDLNVSSVNALEIQFNNPDVIYFGGNGTIYKSTDGGQTWNTTGQATFNANFHEVYSIVMFPGNDQKLLASTNYGLYLSTDAGQNWNQVINAPLNGEYMGDIEIHPADTNTVYAIFNAKQVSGTNKITQFHRSTDGGQTFTALASWPSSAATITGADHQRRAEIAVTPAAPDKIYAILTGASNGGEGLYGVYVSNDRGDTWTHQCCGTGPGGTASLSNTNVMGYATDGTDEGGQYYYDLAIDADKHNPNKVHVAGIMHWVSTDGGANFTCTNSWSNPDGDAYVHADIHDIRIYDNEVWIACDGGIFLSVDSGLTTFNRRQTGIAGTDFWGFGAGFKDGNVMLGGTYHNSHLLKNNNVYLNGWVSYTGSADGFRGFVNPGNNKWVYNDSRKDILPAVRTEPFLNFPFNNVPNASYSLGFSCPLVWHPFCYGIVFSGVDATLWKSEDDGLSWNALYTFGSGNGLITDLEIAIDNPLKMYVVYSPPAGQRLVYKTIDGGNTWISVTPPASAINNNTSRQIDITIDEHQSDNIWLALLSSAGSTNNFKVFRSSDGGASWSNYTSAILNGQTMQSIVHQRGTDGGVWLGTNKTVYYRNNSMSDWQIYADSLPASTSSLKLVPWYKGGKIRNASNRSVWQAPFFELGPPQAQLMADKLSSGCARDTFYFSDYSSAYGNATLHWSISPAPQYLSSNNAENIKVVFGNTGSYSVSLQVSDSLGTDSISAPGLITVGNTCNADTIPGLAMGQTADGQYASASSALNLNTNHVSMSAWIKPEATQPDWAGILFFRGGSTTTGLGFNSTYMQLAYHYDGGNWGWTGGPFVTPDEWNHIALVIFPDSAIIYLNGVPFKRNTSHPAEAFDAPLIIGNDPNSSARTFRGLIDEVCIYNRSLSRDEIREMMHLTKKPAQDSSLVTYLQFNESSGQAYDRAGLGHVSLAGGASRINSTGPFGGGNAAKASMMANTSYSLPAQGIDIQTGNNPPLGDVWVSRINLQPDVTPSAPATSSACYWVIENFGANNVFDEFQQLTLQRTGWQNNPCNNNLLYKRGARADGNVWILTDSADNCSGTLPANDILFQNGNQINASYQLAIGAGAVVSASTEQSLLPETIVVGPNPASASGRLHIYTREAGTTIVLMDARSRILLTQQMTGLHESISLQGIAPGTYFLRCKSGNQLKMIPLVVVP